MLFGGAACSVLQPGALGEIVVRSLSCAITLVALLSSSCASTSILPVLSFDFFTPAGGNDPWNQKIENWQARHLLDPAVKGAWTPDASPLARSYARFKRDLRRKIVAETVIWVQERSKSHYRPDGVRDHWATLGEVIEAGEDDCDGLDLLTFVLLRDLGFDESEIYRAIVVEDGTGQHHMVTLWFEDGHREDPYVLDPTGVVTSELVRMSGIQSWEPIELFDERDHFAVRQTTNTQFVASQER